MVETHSPGGPRRKLRARSLILHLDIDAFLASVVQLTEPIYFGRPLAVGTGVVASRSYEAKRRGVETAMPLSEAKRRCPELLVHEGDAGLALRFRQRVGDIVGRFAARVELTSLDDMYAELGQAQGQVDAIEVASQIRATVRRETGLSVAQGLGATKTLARLATTKSKPGGIYWIRPGSEQDFLDPLPVAMLPGVGPKTAETLATYRIRSIAELRLVDRELLVETFGARGEELYFKARGLPCGTADRLRELDVEHGRPGGSWGETSDTKEIHRTTSLADATADPAQLRAMLAYLVDRAAKALRDRGRVTGRLDVVLGLASGGPSEFEARERPRRSPVSLERGVAIAPPSATTRLLVARANTLVESLLDEHRCLVRLIGVRLGRLCIAARGHQQRFFFGEVDDQEDMRGQRIDAALDRLRERHGFAAVIAGEANALRGSLALGRDGFKLRTPSLTL